MIKNLAAWWQRHRPFRSGGIVPAPPQPKPINAILRGGPGHNRRIKNVIGDKISIPVMKATGLPAQADYHRTLQTLKDGTVVFQQSYPVAVHLSMKVGLSPAMWYSTAFSSEVALGLEELMDDAKRSGTRPPAIVTSELEVALFRMMETINSKERTRP